MRSPVLAVAAGLVAGGIYLVSLQPDLTLRGSNGRARVFEAIEAPWLQQIGPLFGNAAPLAPSTWLYALVSGRSPSQASMAVNATAAVLVAGSVALLAGLLLQLTGSRSVALGTALAMASGPGALGLATVPEGTLRPALDCLLVLTAATAAFRARREKRTRDVLLAAGALTLAALDDLTLLAFMLPLVVVTTSADRGGNRAVPAGASRGGLRRCASLVAGWGLAAALVVWAHAVSASWLWSAQPAVVRRAVSQPSLLELLVASWRWPAFPHDSAATVLSARLGDLGTLWFGDIRVIGTALAILGLGKAAIDWPLTTGALAGSALVVAVAGVLPGTSSGEDRWLVLALCAWPLVAVGLAWIAQWRVAPGRAAAVGLAALLPALNVAAATAAHQQSRQPVVPGPDAYGHPGLGRPIVVASAPWTDRLVLRALRASRPIRVPVQRDLLELAGAGGAVTAVGASDHRLELLGARLLAVPREDPREVRIAFVRRFDPCVSVGESWTDISDAAVTGRLGLNHVGGQPWLLYLAAVRPLRLRAGAFEGQPEPVMESVAWGSERTGQERGLGDAMRNDQVPGDALPPDTARVYRVTVASPAGLAGPVALAMGGLPSRAWARGPAARDGLASVVCAGPGGVDLSKGLDDDGTVIPLDLVDAFGDGWHDVERGGRDVYRWTGDREAEMFWRLDVPEDVEVIVEAAPSAGQAATQSIGLRVDGAAFGDRVMTAGGGRYSWRVPASALRAGVTPVMLTTSLLTRPPAESGDDRALGVRVGRLVVRRLDPSARPPE